MIDPYKEQKEEPLDDGNFVFGKIQGRSPAVIEEETFYLDTEKIVSMGYTGKRYDRKVGQYLSELKKALFKVQED